MPMLHSADVVLWRRVAECCRDGVRLNSSGVMPVDTVFLKLVLDPSVRVLLMPSAVPAGASSSSSTDGAASKLAEQNKKANKRIHELERQLGDLKRQRTHQFDGKGMGKRGDRNTNSAPPGLRGKHTIAAAGKMIFFSNNLPRGCNDAAHGGECGKRSTCVRGARLRGSAFLAELPEDSLKGRWRRWKWGTIVVDTAFCLPVSCYMLFGSFALGSCAYTR